MYDGTFTTQSNSANWIVTFQVLNDDTGEPMAISGATVRVRLKDDGGGIALDGSTDDGVVTITADENGLLSILTWDFSAARMRSVEEGTYDVFCLFEFVGGYVEQAIIGTLPVLDGGFA